MKQKSGRSRMYEQSYVFGNIRAGLDITLSHAIPPMAVLMRRIEQSSPSGAVTLIAWSKLRNIVQRSRPLTNAHGS